MRRVVPWVLAGVQPQARRTWLAGDDVAQAVWRARAVFAGAVRSTRRAARGGGTSGFALDRRPPERPEHPALWHRGAEDALLAGHRPRRVLLLHRYERARERLGSRLCPDERGAGGRRVGRQRDEDLDRRRPPVPLLHRALPHVSPR